MSNLISLFLVSFLTLALPSLTKAKTVEVTEVKTVKLDVPNIICSAYCLNEDSLSLFVRRQEMVKLQDIEFKDQKAAEDYDKKFKVDVINFWKTVEKDIAKSNINLVIDFLKKTDLNTLPTLDVNKLKCKQVINAGLVLNLAKTGLSELNKAEKK